MANKDVEQLVAQLTLDMRQYQQEWRRAQGVSNAQARAIENRFRQMDRRLSSIGQSSARALIAPLTGIAAALSVREVVSYAEAWTKAQNALAVAGVTGSRQADVLKELYQLSQDNAAPLEATVQLYGRAAMAAESLGASQSDLMQLTDSVGLALKVSGQSADQASGALMQLGQALQGNKIQAEEYGSLIDGLYPLLEAAASGSSRWGGSVSKLTADVKAGKVASQEFFRAILAGTDVLRSKAAAATLTLSQSLTQVRNAMIKYAGETDQGLDGTRRLAQLLSSLADNFDETADTALKLAGVLAAALLGRGLGRMIAVIPEAALAVVALTKAMRAGAVAGGLFSAALGPLGLLAGVAAGAIIAFGNWGDQIDDATRSLAAQAQSGAAVAGMIEDTRKAQEAYKSAIASTANAQVGASATIVASTKREFEAKKSLLELELKRQQALIAVKQAELSERGAALKAEIGSSVLTRNSAAERGFGDDRVGNFVRLPDEITGLDKTREALANSPITQEIQRIRAESDLAQVSVDNLAAALNTAFGDSEGQAGGGAGGASDSGGGKSKRLNEYEQMVKRIAETTAATIAETNAQAALNPIVEDYGYAMELARSKHELLNAAQEAGLKVTPELARQVDGLAAAYARSVAEAAKLDEAQGKVRQRAEEARDFNKDLTRGIIDGFASGAKAADVFADSLKKIGSRLLDLAMDSAFSGSSGGGFLSSFLGFFSGGGGFKPTTTLGNFLQGIPGFANGTKSAPGGVALVGERGPELVNLPRGAQVIPNHQLRAPTMPTLRQGGGGQTVNAPVHISIDATGADAAGLARVQGEIASLKRSLPGQIVAGVKDANKRRGL